MLNSFPAPRRGKIIRFSPLKVKILKFLAMFHTNHQKYTRRRSFLQYLNSDFLFYLGWSGSLSTKQAKYNEGCSIYLQKYNNWTCPKKSGPFHWLGVDLNLFKVLGHTWDPASNSSIFRSIKSQEKKWGFSYFVLPPLLHTVFPREESWKSFVFTVTS